MSQAKKNYFIEREDHGLSGDDIYGYLSPCENCAGNSTVSNPTIGWRCADSTLSDKEIILTGEDPDTGSNAWAGEDITQSASRTNVDHRWPYQIFTKGLDNNQTIKPLSDYACSTTCAYLIRIKYKIFTSSRRRSYLQCGLSDIFLIERYNSANNIIEQFNVASSVPFKYEQSTTSSKQFLKKDYNHNGVGSVRPDGRYWGSSASENTYFNPYGLREDYDPLKDKCEVHCGTLLFFAKGDDKIKFRLSQHTNINPNYDINPDDVKINQASSSANCHKRDMLDGNNGTSGDNKAVYNKTQGKFYVSAFIRPVPGDLNEVSKKSTSTGDEKTIKYFPKLY
jgi:hypothetical protein